LALPKGGGLVHWKKRKKTGNQKGLRKKKKRNHGLEFEQRKEGSMVKDFGRVA